MRECWKKFLKESIHCNANNQTTISNNDYNEKKIYCSSSTWAKKCRFWQKLQVTGRGKNSEVFEVSERLARQAYQLESTSGDLFIALPQNFYSDFVVLLYIQLENVFC